MEMTRRGALVLALINISLLFLLVGYPIVKEKIEEADREEIDLGQEEDSKGGQKTEEGQKQTADKRKTGRTEAAKSRISQLPEVSLTLEGEKGGFQVSMWQDEAGDCYFFLPGFARGKGLIVETVEEAALHIDGREVKEGDVLRQIAEEKTYELLLTDREGAGLLQSSLIFMYSSDLPVLCLSTDSGTMEEIDADKENQEAGAAVFYDEKGEILYAGQAESIKGRGNSTWGLAKKPYQIKLCEKMDLFGFGRAVGFNLLANGYDETRLRNQITLELAKKLEMNYVPQGQMIDLYINNCFWGNYYFTEKIQVGENGVAIRDMEELVEAVYSPEELEKIERLENEDGTRKWARTGLPGEDNTGGYLLERELETRFKTEISGFITEQGDCYTLQSPLYASEEQVNYIADLMQEFQDAIEQEDGVHPLTKKHYSEYIDVDSFIQKYLVEEISKNYDGGVTSSFFYKPQDLVSTKIFAGPVWDYDVAFGNCNLDRIASNPLGITRLNDHIYGTDVFVKLYEKEDFYERMVKMYEEKALPYLNTLLDGGIDEMVEGSRNSAAMDSIRWEELKNRYQYYEEYDNDVRYLKYFVRERRNFLNQVWLEKESYHNVNFMVDGEIWQILCVKDGETPKAEPVPSRYSAGSLFMGWFTEDGVPYDIYKPVYEDMIFHASWQELFQKEDVPAT